MLQVHWASFDKKIDRFWRIYFSPVRFWIFERIIINCGINFLTYGGRRLYNKIMKTTFLIDSFTLFPCFCVSRLFKSLLKIKIRKSRLHNIYKVAFRCLSLNFGNKITLWFHKHEHCVEGVFNLLRRGGV